MKIVLILILMSQVVQAGKLDKLYKFSIGTIVASTTLDAATSWRQPELNPLIGQTFGARGVSIKFGVTVGIILVERYAIKKDKSTKKMITITNFALSGAYGFIGVRNIRIRRQDGER